MKRRRTPTPRKSVEPGTEADEGEFEAPWTAEVEAHFLEAVERYPPIGFHRHVNALNLREHVREQTGVELTAAQVYERIRHYWVVDDHSLEIAAAFVAHVSTLPIKQRFFTPPSS